MNEKIMNYEFGGHALAALPNNLCALCDSALNKNQTEPTIPFYNYDYNYGGRNKLRPSRSATLGLKNS